MIEGIPVFQALGGGVLIGLGAVLLMLGDGRIAGISGILGGALTGERGERGWRMAFLLGLAGGGILASTLGLAAGAERTGYPVLLLAVAGVAVGFGSRLGNGCTSGHGVCGCARLSPRSIVATLVFCAAGMLTVGAIRALGLLP